MLSAQQGQSYSMPKKSGGANHAPAWSGGAPSSLYRSRSGDAALRPPVSVDDAGFFDETPASHGRKSKEDVVDHKNQQGSSTAFTDMPRFSKVPPEELGKQASNLYNVPPPAVDQSSQHQAYNNYLQQEQARNNACFTDGLPPAPRQSPAPVMNNGNHVAPHHLQTVPQHLPPPPPPQHQQHQPQQQQQLHTVSQYHPHAAHNYHNPAAATTTLPSYNNHHHAAAAAASYYNAYNAATSTAPAGVVAPTINYRGATTNQHHATAGVIPARGSRSVYHPNGTQMYPMVDPPRMAGHRYTTAMVDDLDVARSSTLEELSMLWNTNKTTCHGTHKGRGKHRASAASMLPFSSAHQLPDGSFNQEMCTALLLEAWNAGFAAAHEKGAGKGKSKFSREIDPTITQHGLTEEMKDQIRKLHGTWRFEYDLEQDSSSKRKTITVDATTHKFYIDTRTRLRDGTEKLEPRVEKAFYVKPTNCEKGAVMVDTPYKDSHFSFCGFTNDSCTACVWRNDFAATPVKVTWIKLDQHYQKRKEEEAAEEENNKFYKDGLMRHSSVLNTRPMGRATMPGGALARATSVMAGPPGVIMNHDVVMADSYNNAEMNNKRHSKVPPGLVQEPNNNVHHQQAPPYRARNTQTSPPRNEAPHDTSHIMVEDIFENTASGGATPPYSLNKRKSTPASTTMMFQTPERPLGIKDRRTCGDASTCYTGRNKNQHQRTVSPPEYNFKGQKIMSPNNFMKPGDNNVNDETRVPEHNDSAFMSPPSISPPHARRYNHGHDHASSGVHHLDDHHGNTMISDKGAPYEDHVDVGEKFEEVDDVSVLVADADSWGNLEPDFLMQRSKGAPSLDEWTWNEQGPRSSNGENQNSEKLNAWDQIMKNDSVLKMKRSQMSEPADHFPNNKFRDSGNSTHSDGYLQRMNNNDNLSSLPRATTTNVDETKSMNENVQRWFSHVRAREQATMNNTNNNRSVFEDYLLPNQQNNLEAGLTSDV